VEELENSGVKLLSFEPIPHKKSLTPGGVNMLPPTVRKSENLGSSAGIVGEVRNYLAVGSHASHRSRAGSGFLFDAFTAMRV